MTPEQEARLKAAGLEGPIEVEFPDRTSYVWRVPGRANSKLQTEDAIAWLDRGNQEAEERQVRALDALLQQHQPVIQAGDQECCYPSCSRPAEFDVHDNNEQRPDLDLLACSEHLSDALGSVPPTEPTGPWTVSLLSPDGASAAPETVTQEDVVTGGVSEGLGYRIAWQDGPLPKNGAFLEDVLTECVERLKRMQATKFNCAENNVAIFHIHGALTALGSRAARREKEGVRGTHSLPEEDS